MKTTLFASAAVAALTMSAQAGTPVQVTVTGTVEFNQIGAPPLGDVMAGDAVTLSFMVDSDDYMDSMSFPTRGYVIDQESFMFQLGSVMIGLQDPFPMDLTPYFVIRNNDPAVDGFFVTSTSVDFPIAVPLNQMGLFDYFSDSCYVTYEGDTLDSLDILDALGTYDFTGLTVFNWSIDDGPFNAMFIDFEQMTIEEVEVGVTVPFDIKPGSCPNSFNRTSHGVLPAAVLGTMDFDVSLIDADSIMLSRADGMGGSVAPLRVQYGDVGTPYEGEPCGCNEMYGDGFMDLKLKFKSQDVTSALGLDMFMGGDMVPLVVSGSLVDGTPFTGTDCIRIVPIGHGGPPMMPTSRMPGTALQVTAGSGR